ALGPSERGGRPGEPRATRLKPSHAKGAFAIPLDRPTIDPRTGILAKGPGGTGAIIARLQASLDRLEQRQATIVDSIADNYDSKARRMRGVLIELGLDIKKPATRDGAGALGGPFIPAQLPKDAMSFERQLHRIQVTRAQITRLTRTLGAVPVRKPVDGELDLQSGFGGPHRPVPGPAGYAYRARSPRRDRRRGARHCRRHGDRRGLERRLWPRGRHRSRQRIVDPLRSPVVDRRSRRPVNQDRADHRQGRFDRTLDRTAPALRNAAQRRGDRPAEIPARGTKARRPLRRSSPRPPPPSARCRTPSARARPP